jgi:hypothetical protein
MPKSRYLSEEIFDVWYVINYVGYHEEYKKRHNHVERMPPESLPWQT